MKYGRREYTPQRPRNRKQETGNRKQETDRGNRNSRASGGVVSYLSTTAVISRPGVTACVVVARSETITMEMSQYNGVILQCIADGVYDDQETQMGSTARVITNREKWRDRGKKR